MFAQMRTALSIPPTTDILTHIHSLPPHEQEIAQSNIRAIESEAMVSQSPQPGLLTLMEYLERKNIPKGICTRNFDAPVDHLLGKFLQGKKFEPIVSKSFSEKLSPQMLWIRIRSGM